VLAELGVADAKDAKAALDAYKKLQDANKTEEQRLREAAARVSPLEQELAGYKAAFAAQAAESMAALTDVQKQAVMAIAGDDPTRQMQTIANLRKSGMLGPAQAAPATATPPPPPANTTAAPAAPSAAPTTTVNHLAVYQEMLKTNPFDAAGYRLRYAADIEAALKK
jgi:hypothetical protein